jgi:SAM-dependent methyltransferase
MLDPSCGDGRFIAAHKKSVGIEQDAVAAREAIERAPWALVHEGDFFQWADATNERFECAAGNPPFIRYQTFKGSVRESALSLCARHGATFSGLSSSWAPFLVAAATVLKPGGRMAFVVPAEIGHAPYAAPLIEYLVDHFALVQVVAIREKLFRDLSEDCWLLFADGFGGRTDFIDLTIQDRFKATRKPPRVTERVAVGEWRTVWNRRLRSLLLPTAVRELYREAAIHPASRRFADFAAIGIGYVSGDNSFFHLRPSEADRWEIPASLLLPSVRNSRALPSRQITTQTVAAWKRADEPALLLRLHRGQELPKAVQRYLDSEGGQRARQGYKCRNRKPWYAVPDVQVPDFVLSYMSGRKVSLVRNAAGVTCTNTVHSVRIRDPNLAKAVLPAWGNSFTQLSCEIEGHALGGGMLKLEPREAGRVLFPAAELTQALQAPAIEEGVRLMQRWRHYAE